MSFPYSNKRALDYFREFAEMLAALPKPIAYIVIDPSFTHGEPLDAEDADGRRYLLVNSSALDQMRHHKFWEVPVLASDLIPSLASIPLYRRQDMPAGWPAEKVLP